MTNPGTLGNSAPSGLASFVRRLENIERGLREMAPGIMRAVGPGIDELQTTQAELTTAQAELVDIVNNQVGFLADFSDVDGPFTIASGSETQLTTVQFNIPDGFARALVVGYGSVGLVNPNASGSSVAGRIYIDGPGAASVFGPLRYNHADAGSDVAVYPYKQTVLTGLSGGESITVRLKARATSTWTNAAGGASLNVQVYYSRT